MNNEVMLERLNELVEFYKKENEELKKELAETHAVVKETENKLEEAALKRNTKDKELELKDLFNNAIDKLNAAITELPKNESTSYLDMIVESKKQKDENALNGNLTHSSVKRYIEPKDPNIASTPLFNAKKEIISKKTKKSKK